MLTTANILEKDYKDLVCEKGSRVYSCGSSWCDSVMYSWAHAPGFHICFGFLIHFGHVCRRSGNNLM